MIRDPALILVDFQNDFCREWDEETEKFRKDPRIQPAVEATASFIERYRDSGRTPIFVGGCHHQHTLSEPWADRYDRPRGMSVRAGSEGAAFVPELQPAEGDVVVRKNRYNAFYQTNLDLYLSTNDISKVLIAGVTTDVCVTSTIHGAYNRDYYVTLLADCTASYDPDQRELTFSSVESNLGTVRSSAEVELPAIEAPVGE